ncbi:flagellar motor protein MotA [Siculibacillus lacustris]|uniref:flagellar motor protein MotA n=1 Tax=Siculibacillus lacustris TaxID=1549641 RepID=UPI001D18A3DA|nr:flagellar motor protein MotA [Siculibacillus lacustris]
MARDYDPQRLSSPQVFLWRMVIFLVIAGFVAVILKRQITFAFMANPGLNAFILFVLALGIVLAVRQVIRLFPEIRWANAFRRREPDFDARGRPRLLGPMSALIGDRGAAGISPAVLRSILDSIGMRLDETRDITRYIGGTLVFLGLLGTFTGLSETVSAVGDTLKSLNAGAADLGAVFEDLKTGLAKPLSGMGVAFSSSLFGLSGSLIIGFLDLQASQAQNRFYNELEDWLSTEADLDFADHDAPAGRGIAESLRAAVERLTRVAQDGGGGSRGTSAALVDLAESLRGLIGHVRGEQAQIRTWIDVQAEENRRTRVALERIAEALAGSPAATPPEAAPTIPSPPGPRPDRPGA